jgi:hypothetical protein
MGQLTTEQRKNIRNQTCYETNSLQQARVAFALINFA